MSKLRQYRRELINKRVKTAIAVGAMVKKMGSYEAVRDNLEDAMIKTFVQREVEVFSPANSGAGSGGAA